MIWIVQTHIPLESKENDDEDGLNNEEGESIVLSKSPPEFQEGRQATLYELQEVNVRTDEKPRPIFISANMSLEEKEL